MYQPCLPKQLSSSVNIKINCINCFSLGFGISTLPWLSWLRLLGNDIWNLKRHNKTEWERGAIKTALQAKGREENAEKCQSPIDPLPYTGQRENKWLKKESENKREEVLQCRCSDYSILRACFALWRTVARIWICCAVRKGC